MTICFLLTHVPNPRMNKRIAVCKDAGDTYVICTRRSSQDIWNPSIDVDHTIYNIDLPSAKHIIKRFVVSQNFQKRALAKLEELKPNVIYAEGLDTLFIAGKYKRAHDVRIIYEVADLRENYITRPRRIIDRLLTNMLMRRERVAFQNVNNLVITSPKFYDLHYYKLIDKQKVLYLPNIPDPAPFMNYHRKQSGSFTVGFIGGIRYIDQMKMLVDAAEQAGCRVLFAGAGGTSSDYKQITAYCKGKDFVTFSGKYRYDEEIAGLYGMVDCVYAVYDAANPNVRIALPNKLYEAVYCELPIIVAKDTYLAEIVTEWGVGACVSYRNTKELEEVLRKLKDENEFYSIIYNNCRKQKELFLSSNNLELLESVIK